MPVLNEEQEIFWRACEEGKFLLKKCTDTGMAFYYPREKSPFTLGETEWFEASGLGEVYSCSVSYRSDPAFCIAYIKLDEGPIMLSNVVADDLSTIAIGQRVKVSMQKADNGKIAPFFVLAD